MNGAGGGGYKVGAGGGRVGGRGGSDLLLSLKSLL